MTSTGGGRSVLSGDGAGGLTLSCTPTLTSKADLKASDMCLVDLDGKQLAGSAARTSEILLHLEIYKAVPEAKACVHCHPPHATAYAITGRVPPTCIIPEFEVFVGRVAVSPYETPGSKKFAETVIPFAKNHNTILLANHGIICWADTVTHAEWYAEVLETYCNTLLIASQRDSLLGWILVIPGDITLLTGFLAAIVYGLRPDQKWDAQFNAGVSHEFAMPDDKPVTLLPADQRAL